MKKIYRDQSLPYDSTAVFDVPEDFDPCGHDEISVDGEGIDEVYE